MLQLIMTNYERANHGSKENQDVRVDHQIRQVERRNSRRIKKIQDMLKEKSK